MYNSNTVGCYVQKNIGLLKEKPIIGATATRQFYLDFEQFVLCSMISL